jgi:peroxiredoxin
MAATLYLLGCMLLPGQTMTRPTLPPASGDLVLVPHLSRAQELVYRGVFNEEGRGGQARLTRSYRLETRLLVLDTPPNGADVAVLTVLKHRAATGEPSLGGDNGPMSVRLEPIHVDLQGKVTADRHINLLVPLDGAPTLECGAFVALPGGRLHIGQEWTTTDRERPPLTWRVTGTEMLGGNRCYKLIGEQKSEDWDHPRADHTAWHRQETVWLMPQLGLAYRLEREILQREPAHREATQRSLLRLEMESCFQLSGQAGDSRRQEVTQALAFRDSLAPLLTQPARYGPRLATLAHKIEQHLEYQPETPYRPALLQIKRRIEAAQRGETPPEPPREEAAPFATGFTVGQRAPDFLAGNFTGGGSTQLRSWMGKPVVLVFYHPASPYAATLLRFAQQLQASQPRRIIVAGLCVSDDAELARRQRDELGLTIPLLSGSGLRTSFGVESTPKIILLDSANIIRGTYLGWGQDTSREVREELQRWLTPR